MYEIVGMFGLERKKASVYSVSARFGMFDSDKFGIFSFKRRKWSACLVCSAYLVSNVRNCRYIRSGTLNFGMLGLARVGMFD